jgi:hypothetical protein
MIKKDLPILLKEYISNPDFPENNFALGLYYDSIGQTAAALSFYIRTAERTTDELLKYECLLRGSMCFDKQGTRKFTVKGLLQHAVAVQPTRPEGYYLLSRFYERENSTNDSKWFDSYLTATIGLKVCEFNNIPALRTQVDYPGKYALQYQQALSAWWCGLCEESRQKLINLLSNPDLDESHRDAIIENLHQITAKNNSGEHTLFTKDKHNRLKNKFPGYSEIETNHSEAYQDMFVLTVLNGKTNGTYLEIGAGSCFYGSNTALLEQQFDWKGISLDVAEFSLNEFENGSPFYPGKKRKNKCVLKDARTIDYEKFLTGLEFLNVIDYLQIDCDPANITYEILLTIPFEKYKFAVITYEHDRYRSDEDYQNKAKKYLESYGYVCVINNVAPDEWRTYEDWFIHPDLVDIKYYQNLIHVDNSTKKAEQIFLSNE